MMEDEGDEGSGERVVGVVVVKVVKVEDGYDGDEASKKSGLLGRTRTWSTGPSIVDVTCLYDGRSCRRKWHTERIPCVWRECHCARTNAVVP
jgi:hypothetical protein